MTTTLLPEIITTDAVTIFLDVNSVEITVDPDPKDRDSDGEDDPFVTFEPKTRQEANRLSVALRKAQRRIEDIGRNLPDETVGR